MPPAGLPRLRQGVVAVLVVLLAACSGASSSPAPSQASPLAVAPSVAQASVVPPSIVSATPTPTICASSCSMKLVEVAYIPRTLTIKVGTEVTWSNINCAGCTVTFPSLSLDSGPMATGTTFKHTFSEAGSFAFHCRLDPDVMQGTIIVTD
jgi:plastocyanin